MINSFTQNVNWFFLLFGVICLVSGLKAVVTRVARTRSRGGHVSHYVGKAAVVQGVVGIVIGVVAIVLSATNLI